MISLIDVLVGGSVLLVGAYIFYPTKIGATVREVIEDRNEDDFMDMLISTLKSILIVEKVKIEHIDINMSAEEYLHLRTLLRNIITYSDIITDDDKIIYQEYFDDMDDMSINEGKLVIYDILSHIKEI